MNTNNFNDYLQDVCFKANPQVLDDDMPDFFERWLGQLDTEELIAADDYATQKLAKGDTVNK